MLKEKKLTILHSNDLHGDFMAEDIDDSLVGGVSMLSGYISQVREIEDNTIYCIAGDMFRGSIIDTEFQGLSTIEIMNALGPDVVTVGNHEVDYGLAHLLFIEKCASFPIINANVFIKTNHKRLFDPVRIVEKDGMRILFIGILTEEVLATTKTEGLIGTFVDCADAAKEVGRICNTYNALDIDLTILLTHIGFEEDKKLAAMLDPAWGVDIIIGGHSHTLIDEPAVVNGIQIVQAGTGTHQIGRFDLVIDTWQNQVVSSTWKTVEINSHNCPCDHKLEDMINHYKRTTDEKYGRIVTRFEWEMTHPDRYQETEAGNLTAEAVRESLGLDIMIVGSGSLRKTAFGPIVTYQDFVEMYAYDDPVHMVTITGKQFKDMVKFTCRDETWAVGGHTEFFQYSKGLAIEYSKSRHEFDRFDFHGEPLADDRILTVGIPAYHLLNTETSLGQSMEEITKLSKPKVLTTSINQVLEEYFLEHPLLGVEVEGRMIIKD